jgi:8-oxo-dGTP diphosphatase
MDKPNVRVGIGVFIFKGNKFLMIKRFGSHGANTWSVPGGHLEYGESFEDVAKREVKEETDLDITNIRFGAMTNDLFEEENKHYITVWLLSEYASGREKIMEPEKCLEQKWLTFETLPKNLFLPWRQLLKSEFLESIKKTI